MVLALESWNKGSNAASVRSLEVNEETVRLSRWLETMLHASLSALDDSKDIWPVKSLCHLSLKVLYQNT